MLQRTPTINWFAGALVSVQLACGAPSLAKMDPNRAIEREHGYQQDGKDLDPDDMSAQLAAEPEAAPHLSRSKTLALIASIVGAAGGALVGWNVAGQLGDGRNSSWGLAAVGGGVILVSVPLALWGASSFDSAVDAHNARVATEPAKTSASDDRQPAGAE
jgi:hypothetical protein